MNTYRWIGRIVVLGLGIGVVTTNLRADIEDFASPGASLSLADYSFIGEAEDDRSGRSVSSAGDVDGDGLEDVLVGAYFNDDGGSKAGKAYLMLGATIVESGSMMDLADADYSFAGEAADDLAGWSVSSAGDVDGDGLSDVLIGAHLNPFTDDYRAKTYLVLAETINASDGLINLSEADYSFVAETEEHVATRHSFSAGDVDGDGLADILIGESQNDDVGTSSGKAYLILGSTITAGGDAIDLADADYSFTGEAAQDFAGYSVSSAGDTDKDGLSDVLIGAKFNSDGGSAAGKTYLVLGTTINESDSLMDLSESAVAFFASGWYV